MRSQRNVVDLIENTKGVTPHIAEEIDDIKIQSFLCWNKAKIELNKSVGSSSCI